MAFRSSNSASSSTSVASITVTAPAGTATGDVLVGGAVTDGINTDTWTLPTGFTALASSPKGSNYDGGAMGCGTKVESGTPPANYTFTPNTSRACAAVVATYSGIDNAAALHQSDGTFSNAGVASPRSMPITSVATTVNCDLVYFASADWNSVNATGYTPPTSYTERADVLSGGYPSITLADFAGQAATASGTVSGTATASSGAAGYMAFWLALTLSSGASVLPFFMQGNLLRGYKQANSGGFQ